MTTRTTMVDTAIEWENKKESDGSFKEIIDVYNTLDPLPRGYKMTYNDPWCAAFVSAVAIKSGNTDIIPCECSCSKMIEGFQELDEWEENDNYLPTTGDIIFYSWEGEDGAENTLAPNHVGIVVYTTSSSIISIEGNINDRVGYRSVSIGGASIRGFGIPRYAEVDIVSDALGSAEKEPSEYNIVQLAKEVIHGDWGNGQERKEKLIDAGYIPEIVQTVVNALMNEELYETALDVIRGKYGNGAERKTKLANAGYDYEAIQNLVNILLTYGGV